MLVDVDKIKDNPLNLEVYGAIVPSDIDTLIESIKQLGLLQPLIITKKYTLISGHRRLACLRELKIKKAECIVKDIEDEEAIVFMKSFELGYPFLWKGRKSSACRRQA